jgi:peptide/nickel transport system permease protein
MSTRGGASERIGLLMLVGVGVLALLAPVIAPHDPSRQFDDRAYAPPTRVHVMGPDGFAAPFIHPLVLEDRLARRYSEDESVRVPLRWFHNGRLVSTDTAAEPIFLFGADALGRDVFSRLVRGAQLSLGVTLVGLAGALLIGTAIGGLAGTVGGWIDYGLMGLADFLLALPGAYLVLVLRGALPLVLSTGQVFVLMALLFALAGWPHAARGVRAIVAAERARDYAEAARAAGAGPWRIARQLLPAARGFLGVEVVLLIPALLVAESTLSYLGLGFADADASWGTMIQDAANGGVLLEAPWLIAPAGGVFAVVLAAQLIGLARGQSSLFMRASRSASVS